MSRPTGSRLRPRLPTRADDWRLMARTVRLVLGLPAYAALALSAAVVALSAFVLGQNLALTRFAVSAPTGLADRATILLGLYPFLGTNYGPVAELLLVAVAALSGVDVALVGYHFREHGLGGREGEPGGVAGGGTVGLILGALGAGCAACGSAVLAGLFSLFGVAGAATLLPFDGVEFSVLALVALVLSIHWVADGMRGGEIRGCPV
ncbi:MULTISPECIES: hypothetical protein [Halorussus]|uniref:hypothetical protein n=1 Tax=Halorussus TaxID=1070314 RepID=UPI000E218D59|nr:MULTISPECIES: hypothetical protein [Halorussus]NHN58971.1 hypothetical protein [Halorussus sp. JP-T4]